MRQRKRDVGRGRNKKRNIKFKTLQMMNLTFCRIKRVCLSLQRAEAKSRVAESVKVARQTVGGNLGELEHGRGEGGQCPLSFSNTDFMGENLPKDLTTKSRFPVVSSLVLSMKKKPFHSFSRSCLFDGTYPAFPFCLTGCLFYQIGCLSSLFLSAWFVFVHETGSFSSTWFVLSLIH
jgi:hypothetical protein